MSSNKRFVWLASDFHRGHEDCDVDSILRYVEWTKKRDVDIVMMGDMLEASVPEHMPWTMFSQIETPEAQLDWLIDTFRPLRKRIKMILLGNHEMRIWKKTSLCPLKIFAKALGIEDTYVGVGGTVTLNAGDQEYSFTCFHGKSGSQNPRYELQKAKRIYPMSDVLALAHNHQLYQEEEIVLLPDGNSHTQHWVRCGSFLNYASYAREAFHPPSRIGNPIVVLRSDRPHLTINISNFVGKGAHA